MPDYLVAACPRRRWMPGCSTRCSPSFRSSSWCPRSARPRRRSTLAAACRDRARRLERSACRSRLSWSPRARGWRSSSSRASGVDAVDVAACTAARRAGRQRRAARTRSASRSGASARRSRSLRSLAHGDREIRAGRWPQLELAQRGGGELAGRRVGIIGMGQIGRECAHAATSRSAATSRIGAVRQREPDAAGGARWLAVRGPAAALRRARRRSSRWPPRPADLIGAEQLALLPPGAFVINAARGGIVDEAALLAAIRSGALAGGALDVYATEPLPADSPLRDEDRLLLLTARWRRDPRGSGPADHRASSTTCGARCRVSRSSMS